MDKMLRQHTCKFCKRVYESRRVTSIYCSELCRSKGNREAQGFVYYWKCAKCGADLARHESTCRQDLAMCRKCKIEMGYTVPKHFEGMTDLGAVNEEARKHGMSYGQYVGMVHEAKNKQRHLKELRLDANLTLIV